MIEDLVSERGVGFAHTGKLGTGILEHVPEVDRPARTLFAFPDSLQSGLKPRLGFGAPIASAETTDQPRMRRRPPGHVSRFLVDGLCKQFQHQSQSGTQRVYLLSVSSMYRPQINVSSSSVSTSSQ